jgi:hypothetical protein
VLWTTNDGAESVVIKFVDELRSVSFMSTSRTGYSSVGPIAVYANLKSAAPGLMHDLNFKQ